MNDSTTIAGAELRVREALRFVAANILQSVLVSTFGAAVLVYLLRDQANGWPALLWLSVVAMIGGLRIWVRAQVRRTAPDASMQRRQLHRFTALAFASGLTWATAPWVMGTTDDNTRHAVVLLSCVAIGAGGAFASLASLRTAFAILWPPMLAPIVYGLTSGSGFFLVISGVTAALSLVLSRMLVVLNRQFVEQVDLRERNAELLLALQQRTTDAEAANEAKSRFLVAASHDLRQPMHAIALRSHALLEQTLPPDAHAIAKRLDDSVVAMQALFDALLDISKLDAGATPPPQILDLPLAELFARLNDGYADIARQQSVQLTVDAAGLWVTSDALMLERILRQLLDNAMRHAARSQVELSARTQESEVVIQVRDSGQGIPHDQLQTIFKEFVQLDNPERDRRKGLGLGLAIVQRLARQLGHRIEVSSTFGKGASFSIHLPRASAPPLPVVISVAAATPLPTQPDESDQPILIALLDDDPDVLEAMQMLLTRWHCNVIAATHSHDLESSLQQAERRPDLLICDYRLAEPRNGRQVIDHLRGQYGQDLPALLITGDVRATETAGDAVDITVLRKPVPPEVLRDAIVSHSGRAISSHAKGRD